MALKAVGGTAHGGLFLDCDERDVFLDEECATYDWGPNAQREWPQHLKGLEEDPLATISKITSPSGPRIAMFGDSTVRDWKVAGADLGRRRHWRRRQGPDGGARGLRRGA